MTNTRIYDWAEIQTFYDQGNAYKQVCAKFGMSPPRLTKAVKDGDLILRPRYEAKSLGHKNRAPHSNETRQKLRQVALERGFGGKNYRKTFEYNGTVLESSFELSLAQDLDANNVTWIRPKRLWWTDDNGLKRHYTPDFYLPDHDVYLDPKNDYLIKVDSEKINKVCIENRVRVLVLNSEQLTWTAIAGMM